MNIGLYDVDSRNFPNLALMKISAWHKSKGDQVEFINFLNHYDKVYVSKVFGDEYSKMDLTCINADEVVYGGTGFAIKVVDGKEVFIKEMDKQLPQEIEHIYPDYSLYPAITKNKAYGFLTRGCCNNCDFCIVSKKEGSCSYKVADLKEWYAGQKEIILLDPNILACKDRLELLKQLADSGACVDFSQGLDARFITKEVCDLLKNIKVKMWHFAFDFMRNEKQIIKGLETFVKELDYDENSKRNAIVYVLTNYDTTFEEDLRRVEIIRKIGLSPFIMIYRRKTAPRKIKDLARWCNNRFIYRSCEDFMQYVPRADGRTIKQLYFESEGSYEQTNTMR